MSAVARTRVNGREADICERVTAFRFGLERVDEDHCDGLAPAEEVYALGHLTGWNDPERAWFHPEDAVLGPPEDGLQILSNQGEAALESEFDSSARSRLVGGAVATVLGGAGPASLLLPV